MKSVDFIAWRKGLGLNQSEAAERLGLARNTIRKYETEDADVPLYVALACAAISFNLPPWRAAA